MSFYALGVLSRWEKVTPQQIAVGFYLADCHNDKTGKCFPSIAYIANRLSLSTRYTQKILTQMQDAGLIKIIHNFDANGRQKTSSYEFLPVNMGKREGEQEFMGEGDTEIPPEGDQEFLHNQEDESGSKDIVGKPDHTPDRESIIRYLNLKTGARFKPNSKTSRKHIDARLSEGHSVEDCMSVIDSKAAEWTGTEFQKFLRPETLFAGKFDSYLATSHIEKPQDSLDIIINGAFNNEQTRGTHFDRSTLTANRSELGQARISAPGSDEREEDAVGEIVDPFGFY